MDGSTTALNFLLGFRNPKFSDCNLRLELEKGSFLLPNADHVAPSEENGRDMSSTKFMPASTLILAAKSKYFHAMFDGNFSEGYRRDEVVIPLPEDGEEPFYEVLRSMYAGCLQQSVMLDYHAILRILILADRFDCPECVSACIDALIQFGPSRTTDDAFLLVSLPPSVLALPKFAALARAARDHLASDLGHLLHLPLQEELLQVPEAAMVAILDSYSRGGRKEEEVVAVTREWILSKYATEAERHEATCRIIIPRIRFLSLSPPWVRRICSWWAEASDFAKVHLQSINAAPGLQDSLQSDSDGAADSTEKNVNGKRPGSKPGNFLSFLPLASALSEAEGGIRAALVAFAEEKQMKCGVVLSTTPTSQFHQEFPRSSPSLQTPADAFPEQMLALKRPRRLSYEDPVGSLYLDVPLKTAMNFHFRSHLTASSPAMLLPRRWFVLKARVEPVSHVLTFALAWDRSFFLPNEIPSFKLKVRFCIQTSLSAPGFEQAKAPFVHYYDSENPEAVLVNAVNLPWANVLGEPSIFFPEGAMRARADVWLLDEDR